MIGPLRWLVLLGAALLCAPAVPQTHAAAVESVIVHGASLVGNLQGNSADRQVFVVLPPSYARESDRRYPVVYLLHGFLMTADDLMGLARIQAGATAAFARGAPEMILVVPDTATLFGGSVYSSSPTVGDFESFIAHDLVRHIDGRYRTIADRRARGIAGHSMGGYGALRIGMKHPEIFSSLYALSPCCLAPRGMSPEYGSRLETMTLPEIQRADLGTRSTFAGAAAWSPAPDKPPFFLDIGIEGGLVQYDVIARWAANAPIAMLPQYLPALRRMAGIAIDIGDSDELLADDTRMHLELERFGIEHDWEVYPGDHTNRIADRFTHRLLPFFGRHLRAH